MKKCLLAGGTLVIASLAIVVWLLSDPYILMPRVEVGDVRQPETLVLGEERGNAPYGLRIRGSGDLDGEAKISLLLGGQPYQVAYLSGEVDFYFGGDWYSDTATIRYEPVNVRSGKVVLHYRIYR